MRRKTRRSKAATTPVRKVGVTSGLAPGMQAINTYLAVANVGASMNFFERAFGFTRGVVLNDTDGQPRYAEMRHSTSVVMLIRRGDIATATLGTSSLYTYVDDVDRQIGAAREAGAGVSEAEDKPWGDRVAVVTDPDGYRWVLASFKKPAPFT
jgi:PhnB protein